MRNVTVTRLTIVRTALRANRMYYKIYLIGLNSFFASLLPMFSLLFLNVSTVIALHKMCRQQDAVVLPLNNSNTAVTTTANLPIAMSVLTSAQQLQQLSDY